MGLPISRAGKDGRTKVRWNITVLAAAAAMLLLVTGCGPGRHKWTRPDATPQLWNRDNYTCMAQARLYQPNPYSPLVVGNNDPSWGLGGVLYQVGQQRQYNDCMRALGWTPEDEQPKQTSQQPGQEAARQALVKLRESEPMEPVCGLGCSYTPEAPGVIVAVSPRAEAQGLRAGDAIFAVDGERILPPGDVRVALGKRKPGDTIVLTLSNNGTERELHVECTDRRLAGQALIAAVEATAQGRWDECAARSNQLEELAGPSARAAYVRAVCRTLEQGASGRSSPDAENAALLYELMRRRIYEAAFTPRGVESVRADALKTIAQLDQWGFPTFARDLQSRLDTPNAKR
ncbi:MAG: PDZ domain-containing protein [Candidatus Binatia bacterium]